MNVTITEYSQVRVDADKRHLHNVGDPRTRTCTLLTAVGSLTLQPGTLFVRVGTDTAIRFDPTGSGSGDLIPANCVDYLGVLPGATVSVSAG